VIAHLLPQASDDDLPGNLQDAIANTTNKGNDYRDLVTMTVLSGDQHFNRRGRRVTPNATK
jgi:hypothetical protein